MNGSTGFERNWYCIRIHPNNYVSVYDRDITRIRALKHATRTPGIVAFSDTSPLWKQYAYLFAEDEDDGELPCGCIDVCRRNCDGRWDR